MSLSPVSPWKKRADFAALCAWLSASGYMAITAWLWFGQDFRGYYAAAHVLLKGGNPYDYNQLAPVLLTLTGYMGNNPYYYPPWFAWFFVPLTPLPFAVARGVWLAINGFLWAFGLWRLGRLLQWPPPGWQRWLIFLLATFLFAWMTWRYEQTGILLFTLLVEALLALQEKRWFGAGVWLALLLLKPNIMLIPVGAITVWLLRQKQWQPVISLIAVSVGLLLAATVVTPDWYQPVFEPGFGRGLREVLDGPRRLVGMRINTTLVDWLAGLQVGGRSRTLIYTVALANGAIVLIYIVWRSRSLHSVVVAALLISFLLTPYALQYDYPPLTFPLFWAMARLARTPSSVWVGAAISGFIASVPFWERPVSDGYWISLGLSALTLWSWWNSCCRAMKETMP